nr:hypothetical protein GCM10011355_23310 [Aquisalinus luteolus]
MFEPAAIALLMTKATVLTPPDNMQRCAMPVLWEDMEYDTPLRRALAGHPNLSLEQTPDGGTVIAARYVGNEEGSERIVVRHDLPVSGTDFTLRYDVWLPENFQFVRGGKMHGLGPADPVTGGDPIRPDGWSARVMWRTGGAPVNYVYYQGMSGEFGDDGRAVSRARFTPGAWHRVALHVVLNTPDGRPGSSRVYLNGELVNVMENLTYRTEFNRETDISQLLFSTFFGGNDPSWAPKDGQGNYVTLTAHYDNIAVHPGLCTGMAG